MHASWKRQITLFARSPLTGACRRRSTAWWPRAGRRWSAISIIWKHLFARPARVERQKFFANVLCKVKLFAACPPAAEKNMLMQQLNVRKTPPVEPSIAPAQRLHVAIISDGNGRWASSRGLPRSAGHRAGAEAARRVIEAAPGLAIHTLTLRQAIADSEAATANGTRLHLRLAVDYSAREAIYHAACRFYKVTELSPESFS